MSRRMHLMMAPAIVITLLCVAGAAHAIIVVTPKPGTTLPHSTVQLVEQHVDVKLTDRAAEVSVECVYYNSYHTVLEGEWIFPLPAEAAVDRFSMFVGGEEIKAELLDAATARRIYEDIVRQTRDPALLEYADRQLLRARVYPIEPLKNSTIKLYYTHPLAADFGVTDFVFPILSEEWSPMLWNDPQRRLTSAMTIDITTLSALKSVTSPTHPAQIDYAGEHHATVTGAPAVLQQAGDFHLLCQYDTREIAAQFLTASNEDGNFFMGIIAPGTGEGLETLAKDVVFCFDRSGSMHGDKIRQAREALKFCLRSLNAEDRAGLVFFNDGIDLVTQHLEGVSGDGREEALNLLDKLPAEGGTYIQGGLKAALALFEPNDRPKYLVFLTDGLPTIGATDSGTILSDVRSQNTHGARVFTFGVGYDLNAGLLNDLADQNNGFSSYVAPEEDVEVAVSNFFRKMSRPVLADCRLNFDGAVTVSAVYPPVLPDVFAGNEILVLGRFDGSGDVTAHLTGKRGADTVHHSFNASFTPKNNHYPFVAKLWAGRRIGFLLDQMRASGESEEVRNEIVHLSKKYGIMTPYTSFLAAPERPQIAGAGDNVQHLSPPRQELAAPPSDVNRAIESSKLRAGANSGAVYAVPEGDGSAKSVVGAEKTVSGRRFTLIDSVWTDWEVASGKSHPADTIAIKPYSDAYFRLTSNPEIAAILSMGKYVIFLWRNTLIRIDESGVEAWNNNWSHVL